MQSGFSSSSSDAYGQSNCWAFKHPRPFTVWCAFLFEPWIATLITLSECVLIKLFMLIRLISQRWKVVGIFHSCVTPATTKQLREEVDDFEMEFGFQLQILRYQSGNKRKVIKQSMINQGNAPDNQHLDYDGSSTGSRRKVFLSCSGVVGRRSLLILSRRPLVINGFSAENANKPNRKSGRQTAECEENRSLLVDWLFEILFLLLYRHSGWLMLLNYCQHPLGSFFIRRDKVIVVYHLIGKKADELCVSALASTT